MTKTAIAIMVWRMWPDITLVSILTFQLLQTMTLALPTFRYKTACLTPRRKM